MKRKANFTVLLLSLFLVWLSVCGMREDGSPLIPTLMAFLSPTLAYLGMTLFNPPGHPMSRFLTLTASIGACLYLSQLSFTAKPPNVAFALFGSSAYFLYEFLRQLSAIPTRKVLRPDVAVPPTRHETRIAQAPF